ncbi:hypothetical protein HYH02_012065 [Chlamydomonas schloesseri]|uniref:Uncharacterized protein n=1 Tax=Chlamydomonas schloesseri TaxID=2026947 RepID=A0A835SXN9_9CHLO|nr:hypothetical protein HYH02_012065 [Chlamydomonas schloesseri]|eukprot:KAG2435069.1 hypothetical protein HYH02_012065 [Chlamydomonas schloesseri]
MGTRLEELELQLCGGAVVPCEGLLALAAAARGATATRAASAAGGSVRSDATAERTREPAAPASAAAVEPPCWILGRSPRIQKELPDRALLEQRGEAAVAAAVETGPPPVAVAVVGGTPVRRAGGATGGRGLRELRVILALDKHMHIGPFRYGTQARPGGAVGRCTGAEAWRRNGGGATAAAVGAWVLPLAQAATGRAVPPAVAAIASLAPTLRSLELAGPCVERVLDPPGRLLGLSALTALQRLRVELPAATEPYGSGAAGGAGVGYGVGGGGRFGGGGGGGGGASAWDGGGGGGGVSDGGATCDGAGGWKLGPLLAAMPWIRDLDLGPSYRLPPEALVSLAALSQLSRLRCGSIATPPPQQYRSLAAAAAAATAAATVAALAASEAPEALLCRQSSSAAGAGAGSITISGRGMAADETLSASHEVPPVIEGAEAGLGAVLLPLPAGVLQLPLPVALEVLEVCTLPAVPVLAALAALPRLSDLRVTPAAPSAPASAVAAAPAACGSVRQSTLPTTTATATAAVAACTRLNCSSSSSSSSSSSGADGSSSLPRATARPGAVPGAAGSGGGRVWVLAHRVQSTAPGGQAQTSFPPSTSGGGGSGGSGGAYGGGADAAAATAVAPVASGAATAQIPAAAAPADAAASSAAASCEPLRLALVGDEWEHGQHHPGGGMQLQRERAGRRLAAAGAAEQGPPGAGGAGWSQPQEVVTAARLLRRVLPPASRRRLSLHPFTRSPARLAGPHAAWMSELWPLAGDGDRGGGGSRGGGGGGGGVEAVEVAGLDLAAGDLEALLAALPGLSSLGLFMCRLPDGELARRLQAERPGLAVRVDSSCVFDHPPAAASALPGSHMPYGRGGYGR